MEKTPNVLFTVKISKKQREFDFLLEKFHHEIDPVERYMIRLEMIEIQQFLLENGIRTSIP